MIAVTPRSAPYLLVAPAFLVFLGLVVTPLIMTGLLSFYDWGQYKGIVAEFTLKNWREIFSDDYYGEIFLRTFRISLLVTLISVVLGVPEAYILSRMRAPWRGLFLLVVIGPLLVSVVARTLGWALLFGSTGLINQAAMRLGLLDQPIDIMFTETGVVIALTHVLVPFMILSVWAALQRLDPQIENAALSLGSTPFTVLRRVVLPQIIPGILSGSVIVFALAASAFATPAIIGGRRLKVVATLAYDEFLNSLNWPLGAAIAVLLLIGLAAIIVGSNQFIERRYAGVFQ
jgi:putative spermidine/putrescine transport system permease protein